MVTAAAVNSEVWVITRPRFRAQIDRYLADRPEIAPRIHIDYLDLPSPVVRLKRHGWDLYWYYALWQRALARRARVLHGEVGFDVAHHVTFANDWMPCGLMGLKGVPMVWGPVGGSSRLPIGRLARWLGTRGTATEIVRRATTGLARRLWGAPTARRARLVIAQNPDVARVFAKTARSVLVEPNASLDELPVRDPAQVRPHHAVFAGRLLAWKGAALALAAVAHTNDWTLTIYGEGYERRRLERQADRLGISARVEFAGHRPRTEVLEAISRASAFLFPSMHDQAGWVVAEASTMGCPVVCLPLGGPPVLAQPNDHIVPLRRDLPTALAEALEMAATRGGEPTDRWSAHRLPDMVDGWYGAALAEPSETPRLRVLESFGIPKETTNPYITQLYRSLLAQPHLDVRTFTFRHALTGRYDVVHTHWPELMSGGHGPIGRAVRRVLTALTIARWLALGTPVVRTRHNLERPTNISRIESLLLDGVDAATTLDIALNHYTPARGSVPTVVIPHGHYRDWFAEKPAQRPVAGRVAYVGLIRRYKGVEDLVDAFAAWNETMASLHIAGKPSTEELLDALRDRARGDDRISFDPRFLADEDFVAAITSAELIVLPYRHMHNSGTALAALSLGRPVLVPDNEVNRSLAAEVGSDWVHTFIGTLTASDLDRAWSSRPAADAAPDLSGRDWGETGSRHVAAFRAALGGGKKSRARNTSRVR